MLRQECVTPIESEPSLMNVLALTILISACLGGIFILCFLGQVRASRQSSPERDSLLPLENKPPH